MRNIIRTVIAIGLAVGLIAVFLRNADLHQVWASVKAARADYLWLAMLSQVVVFLARAKRWQYVLEPLGKTRFNVVFRTTIIGFAALAVLPARAGEVIRPYLLARQEGLSVPATFATVVLERILDLVAVLLLLASFLVFFDGGFQARDSAVFSAVRFGGLLMTPVALGALLVMFFMAGHPETLHRLLLKAEAVLPSGIATIIARFARSLAEGFAVVRQLRRLLAALAWSMLIWVAIAGGIWAVSIAFGVVMPFTGSFLMLAPLVVGVAVPTPGGVGGFHEAYRIGATAFYGAANDTAVGAAIVLHAISMIPVTILGLVFMLQDGFKLRGLSKPDAGIGDGAIS